MKKSLIGGLVSRGSAPNVDFGENIQAEVLQIKFSIMKQAVAFKPNSQFGMQWEEDGITLRLWKDFSLVQQSYFDRNIKL